MRINLEIFGGSELTHLLNSFLAEKIISDLINQTAT